MTGADKLRLLDDLQQRRGYERLLSVDGVVLLERKRALRSAYAQRR